MSAQPARYLTAGRLAVEIHADRPAMGEAAGRAAAAHLHDVIAAQGHARVIFACAPSQDEFLTSLIAASRSGHTAVDWSRVTAFHMDDYVGLAGTHPQSFRTYLREHLLRHVKVGAFHPIPAEEPDAAGVCARYTALLAEKPIDLICLGIGENGHIAFNDPPVADFEDPHLIKIVELDHACRLLPEPGRGAKACLQPDRVDLSPGAPPQHPRAGTPQGGRRAGDHRGADHDRVPGIDPPATSGGDALRRPRLRPAPARLSVAP
jgi:6-phosphogluconolactonase/glucosamine-6-phosphate isomerase/deaminase